MQFFLKQRLVGAAVLVALAVLIIPMLLDGSGRQGVREIPIPPQPAATSAKGSIVDQSIPLPPVDSRTSVVPEPAAASAPAQPEPETASASTEAPAPAVPVQQAPAPAKPAAAEPVKAAPTGSVATAPAAPSTVAPALKSWVVQVGSFAEQGKAMALRDKLRKGKFNAYVERYAGADKRTLYRVRVGPELDRAKAEALQRRLRDRQKLNGFVTQHP